MGAFLSSITTLLGQAAERIEIAAQNIANVSSPGFKRHVYFTEFLTQDGIVSGAASSQTATDFTQAQQIETGSPLDLALLGEGFFVVRSEDGFLYTRAGKFDRASDGRVVNADGFSLQLEGGADLILSAPNVRIHDDGTVIDGDRPIGKLWIVDFDTQASLVREGGVFSAPEDAAFEVASARVRQASLETSNVSNTTEMLAIMEAVRQAEAGQKLMRVYDQVLARTLTTIGQN